MIVKHPHPATCPEHGLKLHHVVSYRDDDPQGIWACPVDKRTGKSIYDDPTINGANPLPDEAGCDFMVEVERHKGRWRSTILKEDE